MGKLMPKAFKKFFLGRGGGDRVGGAGVGDAGLGTQVATNITWTVHETDDKSDAERLHHQVVSKSSYSQGWKFCEH